MHTERQAGGRRIALLAGSYDRRRDGVSVYIENLLLALLREHAAGRAPGLTLEVFGCAAAVDTLRAIVDRHSHDAPFQAGLRYHTVPGQGLFARTARLSWQVTRRGPFDAVLLPNLQPLPIPGRKLSVLHDLTYQVARGHFSRRRFRYMDWLTRLRLRADDTMGVISQTTRAHLRQYYPAAAHKQLLDLPNGLPETKLGEPAPRQGVHAKLRKQPLELVFCGRLNRLKGVDRALAFARLLDEQAAESDEPAPVLHLVGKSTPETEALLAGGQFRSLQLVRHGYLDDDELNDLYQQCGFALFLSRNEGFGLPVIEAIWSGMVPLVSDIPIFAEVLGAAYPRFSEQDFALRAMRDFVTRLRGDGDYRELILDQLQRALDTHRDGYQQSARRVLAFAEQRERGDEAAKPAAQSLGGSR